GRRSGSKRRRAIRVRDRSERKGRSWEQPPARRVRRKSESGIKNTGGVQKSARRFCSGKLSRGCRAGRQSILLGKRRMYGFQSRDDMPNTQRLIDVSHIVEHGMVTYKGLPAPLVCDYLSRVDSQQHYAPGVEFHIGKVEMVANTGTYLDSPFHRYPDGAD